MSRTMLAALTLLAVAACGRGDKREVASADSLSRDLQLAPVDTTAALNDRPSADTADGRAGHAGPRAGAQAGAEAQAQADAAPAPAPAGSGGRSRPPAPAPPRPARPRRRHRASRPRPTPRSARTRTRWVTRSPPRSASDVKDAAGRVVIPAGSKVTLQVTAIKESENKSDTTGTLTLKPTVDRDQRQSRSRCRPRSRACTRSCRAAGPTRATSPRSAPGRRSARSWAG